MHAQRTLRSPLWKQIMQALRRDIIDGSMPPGHRLPTELELADRFRVNRHTVRRALAELQGEGLLTIEQGRGTFVREQVLDYPVSRRTRFRENLSRQRRIAGGTLIASHEVEADRAAAESLLIARGSRLAMLEILREADGRPVSVATHFFPLPRFRGIDELFRASGSITTALAQLGVADYVRQTTCISSRLPSLREAELLCLVRTRPLTVLTSVNVDLKGVPIDFGVTRYAGDRVQVVVHFNENAA